MDNFLIPFTVMPNELNHILSVLKGLRFPNTVRPEIKYFQSIKEFLRTRKRTFLNQKEFFSIKSFFYESNLPGLAKKAFWFKKPF